MCRLAAYSGPSIPLRKIVTEPVHSLVRQSVAAEHALVSVNGDGLGVCWYGDEESPGVYKDVMPAWSDSNFSNICRLIKSNLFMAHVRAATHGETSRANCHPVVFERWSFMHNGQIPHINRIRRELESHLTEAFYNARLGTTDSELYFLLLLSMGLEKNPILAWQKSYGLISRLHRIDDDPIRMTCVLTNGRAIYAFRQSSDHTSPSLFQSRYMDSGGRALASEPLDKLAMNWKPVPEDTVCTLYEKTSEQESLV